VGEKKARRTKGKKRSKKGKKKSWGKGLTEWSKVQGGIWGGSRHEDGGEGDFGMRPANR